MKYTNALFLLPNGKYGNANEAGNYAIGYAHGYAGSQLRASRKANIYSYIKHGKADDSHEQQLLIQGQLDGLKAREKILKAVPK